MKANHSMESEMVRTSQMSYKFYEKIGFELEKVERNFRTKGFDLYQMKNNLTNADHDMTLRKKVYYNTSKIIDLLSQIRCSFVLFQKYR